MSKLNSCFPEEARDEKDRILSHWNIDPSNPMVFLQQEEAKKFFTQYSEDNLYDFFEKGSQLAKIPQIEEKIASEIKMYYNSVEKCQKEEEEIKKEIDVLKEKQKYFASQTNRKKDHFRRAKWSKVANCERQLEQLIQQDLAKNQKGHNLTMENLRIKELSLKDIEDEIGRLNTAHAMLQDKIEKARTDIDTHKGKLEELRQKEETIENKINEAKYKIGANLNEINSQREAKRKAQQSRRTNGTHSANQDDQLSEQVMQVLSDYFQFICIFYIHFFDFRSLMQNSRKMNRKSKISRMKMRRKDMREKNMTNSWETLIKT